MFKYCNIRLINIPLLGAGCKLSLPRLLPVSDKLENPMEYIWMHPEIDVFKSMRL